MRIAPPYRSTAYKDLNIKEAAAAMSEKNEHYNMPPMSGETVETDGIYQDEAGRERRLNRGDTFPSDLTLGQTEWELVELEFDNHHEGRTDPRLTPQKEQAMSNGKFIRTNFQHVKGKNDRG